MKPKSEQEYIDEIVSHWPKTWEDTEPSESTVSLINVAVAEHIKSERLWIMRGDLYQLINFDESSPVEESLRCYNKAIEINPRSYEAYFEKASFIDTVLAKPRKAKQYFKKSRLLKNAISC